MNSDFKLEVNISPEVIDKYLSPDDLIMMDNHSTMSVLHYITKWESGEMQKDDFERTLKSIKKCAFNAFIARGGKH